MCKCVCVWLFLCLFMFSDWFVTSRYGWLLARVEVGWGSWRIHPGQDGCRWFESLFLFALSLGLQMFGPVGFATILVGRKNPPPRAPENKVLAPIFKSFGRPKWCLILSINRTSEYFQISTGTWTLNSLGTMWESWSILYKSYTWGISEWLSQFGEYDHIF